MVLSHSEESLDGFLNKELVRFSLFVASKDLDELFGHLEVGRLKAHVFSRAPVKDEAKIDMDEASLIINKNVTIVPVLDLQDETHDAVCRQTPDEIKSCLLKGFARFVAILLQKVVVEIDLKCLANLVSAVRVWNNFNNSSEELLSTCSVADAFVWRNEEIKITLFEDLLEQLDELQGQNVLSKIIIYLKNTRNNSDGLVNVLSWSLDCHRSLTLRNLPLISL